MFGERVLGRVRAARGDAIPWSFRQPLVVRSALRRWRGMVGMVFAVGGALGLVMMLLFLAQGSTWFYVQDYVESGVDLYTVRHGGVMIPILPGDSPGTLKNARQLLAQARAMPEVRGALGVMIWQLERTQDGPRRGQPSEMINVAGVDGDPERIPDALKMRQGRWLRRPDEAVVGRKLAKDKNLAVGDTLTLDRRRLTIVGIGRLRGVGFGGDGTAFLGMGTLRDLSGLGDAVNVVLVDASDDAAARARLVAELDSVDVWDRPMLISAAQQANSSGFVFMGLISGVALFIAGVFVSSMLLRSVAERRIEFATLRAVGVPNRTVIGLVLAEALLVTGLGALVGAVIGTLLSLWMDAMYAELLGIDSLYRIDPGQFLAVFAVALGIGVLAGWLPARRALQVEPADVLREG
ncbi:MAG TPA: ABC transporter permease [Chloroflexota bacterium]|jgi:ABC-type lipoprotein release transport system permease subunit|nr:ABC transporter permease [Chloroflexota bacterium]